MLTLTRKVGETIKIGDDIEIVVKEIRKNQVRIGIVAPQHVKIYREEVYENIQMERGSGQMPAEHEALGNENEAPPPQALRSVDRNRAELRVVHGHGTVIRRKVSDH